MEPPIDYKYDHLPWNAAASLKGAGMGIAYHYQVTVETALTALELSQYSKGAAPMKHIVKTATKISLRSRSDPTNFNGHRFEPRVHP